jgi:hypothetical protein
MQQVAIHIISSQGAETVLGPPMPEAEAAEWIIKVDTAMSYTGNTTLTVPRATFKQQIVLGAWLVSSS